ncbi:heparan-sulfate 6-O-sulfotransferase 1-like protein [Euroglyphus maynei]|uniref:Heparan-sulfate 6-O-sulfotransferase n=1 Tax=Euroglyphus maynei TaxID=6958 RepID=A0A1Y3AX81_EURMA|nr:heparan-sulfate 6-O-sulfotransferase 1-like protein [Euroglyphus maynei]
MSNNNIGNGRNRHYEKRPSLLIKRSLQSIRKYNSKRFLMIIILLAIISIITISIYFSDSFCLPKKSIYDQTDNEWISSNNYLHRSYDHRFYPGDQKLIERLNIDRILLHKFGYDYEDFARFKAAKILMTSFDDIIKHPNSSEIMFQLNANDVLVFLHMQKTGGSAFDRRLVRDLILPQPCKCDSKRKKKCRCFRPGTSSKYWLFSRYSIGWKCGLHADYTELTNCVDRILNQMEFQTDRVNTKRNFYFMTLLRDPISRFLSEFKHVERGATWKTSRHWCDGRLPTSKEIPYCFHGTNWRNVSLDEFMNCPHNLAFNRQTRMLADLNLVGCYNRSFMTREERDSIMLFSAKQNLRKMAMFGLCEEQLATQYMFEKIFRLQFRRSFIQFNQTHSHEVLASLSQSTIQRIRDLNHLDMKLYSYAKQLFRQRFAMIKADDPNFNVYYQHLITNSQLQLKRSKQNKFFHSNRSPTSQLQISTTIINNPDESDNLIDGGIDYDDTSPINDSNDDYYV